MAKAHLAWLGHGTYPPLRGTVDEPCAPFPAGCGVVTAAASVAVEL